MFSAPKHRDRSRSSQRSTGQRASLDISFSRPFQVPSPGAGTKRLFSDRNTQLSHNADHAALDEPEPSDAPATIHSEKRQRSGNWPLPESSPATSTASRRALHNRNAPNSPNIKRPGVPRRPSKFVEGSMNDRISQTPSTAYLGLEEDTLMENHAWEQATKPRPHSYIPPSSIPTTGQSDVSKHSSIFRFGKSIAATFNPTNWKLFSKQDRTIQEAEAETPQQRILRERQEKAEKIYAELKQTGHFPTIQAHNVDSLYEPRSHTKHDSGVSFPDDREASDYRRSLDSQRSMSKEEKRRGMVFLEPPSSIPCDIQGHSPAISNFSTPSRTSFSDFKRVSLSNIKKKFSYDGNNDSVVSFSGTENSARRIPSRKDLQKQQKLVKKVSNLEGKLESARRQLNETLVAPLPPREHYSRGGRRKFIPGAMPTLPSERLLAGYVSHDNEEEDKEEKVIGRAISQNATVAARHSLEERRGRSRAVQVPEISPSHFYPTSPLTAVLYATKDKPVKTEESLVTKQAMKTDSDYMTSEVSTSTKLSNPHSVYEPDKESNAEQSEDFSAVDSSSISSPSDQSSEDEAVTPKAKRRKSTSVTPKKSAATTPSKKVNTPTKKSKLTTKTTPTLRKRKALTDNSDSCKPSGGLATGESEVQPAKRLNMSRKNGNNPVNKVQQTAKLATALPSPPRRLPPVPPTNAMNETSESLSHHPTTEQEPTAENAKPMTDLNPSTRAFPTRKSSKAVYASSARVGKPKSVLKDHPRARQSASPPPSTASFEPRMDLSAPARLPTVPMSSAMTSLESDGSVDVEKNSTGQGASTANGKIRGRGGDIPPMPRLPKTVRLPTGEIVDVKVKAPITVPKANSRSGSRVGRRDGSVVSTSRTSKVSAEKEKNAIPKSDTRTSFEWPDDCF